MTGQPDLIEQYLDELLAELRGRARDVRRTLAEAEDHLREATRHGRARGLSEAQAQQAAIERFGTPRTVAGRFAAERSGGVPFSVLVEAVLALTLVAGIGLVAIGASGALAGVLGPAVGKTYVAGDPSGVTYTPARCADFREYFPKASTCEAAATAHHFDEIVTYRLAAGVLGLLVLAGYGLVRRRRPSARGLALPDGFTATIGTVPFAVAAAVLCLPALGSTAMGDSSGAGGQLTGGVVAALAAAGFATSLYRTVRARV